MKKELKKLRDLADEYRAWHVSGESKDPFAKENAWWAVGLINFLDWLNYRKKLEKVRG